MCRNANFISKSLENHWGTPINCSVSDAELKRSWSRKEPVSRGFRPTRALALPARSPLRDLAPPPSQRHILENILVFRPSNQESFWNMVWQFNWQWICASQTQSQCCLIFSKVGVDFLVIVYVNIVLQLRAWFSCVFLILPNLSIVSWVILVSD